MKKDDKKFNEWKNEFAECSDGLRLHDYLDALYKYWRLGGEIYGMEHVNVHEMLSVDEIKELELSE